MENPNLKYIKKLAKGDKAFEVKLINIIKTEFPDEIAIYFNNFERKNYRKAAQNVHKLKHKIGVLGLEKSYQVAEHYENNLRGDNIKLSQEFEAILENITVYLTQI